ncbi:intradiol ring-cleavage dioxygenase [Undibacterium sp. CY18W]|uniref:Intradiol ring-cleavage dioxygenase n=1 Tax=Undibacterium hunanense TaxID=2762292 RepID=A0ABR6ZR60_9BURK|nr:intradiol ring-cleavage dioxygenase [Undibacterium hunanense]MBC3918376.1 intradiol ring-cleavage dioxygenase [Undibacterium hunanense]
MDKLSSHLETDLNNLLQMAANRRQMLRWLSAGSAMSLLACGGGSSTATGSTTTSTTGTTTSTGTTTGTTTGTSTGTTTGTTTAIGSCTVIPEETAGPYPGDGSNSNGTSIANALLLSGIVRSDIRSSIAGASAVAAGVPLTIKLQLVNTKTSCASLAGYAIYLWHCDRDGNYSMYSSGITNENYLRGVQETDSSGNVSFTTIFPGCYSGRIPHVHFEVYPSLSKISSANNKVKTSQFTFPMATLNEAYQATGYTTSVRNLSQITYATDNVFSDGTSLQMVSVTGSATLGYVVTLSVAISV